MPRSPCTGRSLTGASSKPGIPGIRNRSEPSVQGTAQRVHEIGKRSGKVFVLAPAEAVAGHCDRRAQLSVVRYVEVRQRSAAIRLNQGLGHEVTVAIQSVEYTVRLKRRNPCQCYGIQGRHRTRRARS